MSMPKPLRCAWSRCTAPTRSSSSRNFHCSKRALARPNHPNVPAINPRNDPSRLVKRFKPYSKEDLEKLKEFYTPAQFAAIEAGEAATDPEDLANQATYREDQFAFEYIDDFAKIHPIIDKPVKAPKENVDMKQRFKTEDEIAEDFAKFVNDLPEKPTRLDYMKFRDNLRLTVGKEEAERNPRSSLAPEIPKGLEGLRRPGLQVGDADVDPTMKRLMRQTGFSLSTIRSFRVKNLVQHRVNNQTRLGRNQSMYYLTIAGNGRGLLGIGEGKSAEPEDAKRQARFNAIRNLQPIPRYEDRTIFGDVKVKMGAVEIELMTRPPGSSNVLGIWDLALTNFAGFGIRCQDKIFEMCRCAGIQDLGARVTRSRNPMNTIKATFQALISQRIPDEVARGLGKKLVDVRKVYYAGNV